MDRAAGLLHAGQARRRAGDPRPDVADAVDRTDPEAIGVAETDKTVERPRCGCLRADHDPGPAVDRLGNVDVVDSRAVIGRGPLDPELRPAGVEADVRQDRLR